MNQISHFQKPLGISRVYNSDISLIIRASILEMGLNYFYTDADDRAQKNIVYAQPMEDYPDHGWVIQIKGSLSECATGVDYSATGMYFLREGDKLQVMPEWLTTPDSLNTPNACVWTTATSNSKNLPYKGIDQAYLDAISHTFASMHASYRARNNRT